MYISIFYLTTSMEQTEYFQIAIKLVLHDFMHVYGLCCGNPYIPCTIPKGVWRDVENTQSQVGPMYLD